MSKSATRDGAPATGSGPIAWRIAQTLWVGALWSFHFLILPALEHRVRLAPILVETVSRELRPILVGLAAVCVAVQALVLVCAVGLGGLWRDFRGQVLLSAAVFASLHLVLAAAQLTKGPWLAFSYLSLAFFGLVLLLQPIPGQSGRSGG